VGQLSIERLAIANAPTQELRPIRDGNSAGKRLRQQSPKLRVMPTQIVSSAIAVRTNTRTQPQNLSDELVPTHAFEVVIHDEATPPHWRQFRKVEVVIDIARKLILEHIR
jgi:hypothetical protein